MAKGENPVLSTLLDINAVSLERTELDPQSLILIGWPPSSRSTRRFRPICSTWGPAPRPG